MEMAPCTPAYATSIYGHLAGSEAYQSFTPAPSWMAELVQTMQTMHAVEVEGTSGKDAVGAGAAPDLAGKHVVEVGTDPESPKKHVLEVKDVTLEVPNEVVGSGQSHARLLHGACARFESGEVSVIMGPSGGGKTTIMSTVVGKVKEGSRTCGRVLLDGEERDPDTWLSEVAYLEQGDYQDFPMHYTAKEYIRFYVRSKAPLMSMEETEMAIDEVMEELNIEGLKDQKLQSLSGGQKLRVKIASRLAASPKVLILDEPTSGLDSHGACVLVRLLKSYARRKNKIVIMTVHQPGPYLFSLFDKFTFVFRGLVLYSGPADEFMGYLNAQGIEKTEKMSEAEFLFELFPPRNGETIESRKYKNAVNKMIADARRNADKDMEDKEFTTINHWNLSLLFSPSSAYRIAVRKLTLGWRTAPTFFKPPLTQLLMLLWSTIVMGGNALQISSVTRGDVFGVGINSPISLQNSIWFVVSLVLGELSTLVEGVSKLSEAFIKELEGGVYNLATLYVGMLIAEIPYIIFRSLVYFVVYCGIMLGMNYGVQNPLLWLVSMILGSFGTTSATFALKALVNPSKIWGMIISIVVSAIPLGLKAVFAYFFRSDGHGRNLSREISIPLRILIAIIYPGALTDTAMNISLARQQENVDLLRHYKSLFWVDLSKTYFLAPILLLSLVGSTALGIVLLHFQAMPDQRYQLSDEQVDGKEIKPKKNSSLYVKYALTAIGGAIVAVALVIGVRYWIPMVKNLGEALN